MAAIYELSGVAIGRTGRFMALAIGATCYRSLDEQTRLRPQKARWPCSAVKRSLCSTLVHLCRRACEAFQKCAEVSAGSRTPGSRDVQAKRVLAPARRAREGDRERSQLGRLDTAGRGPGRRRPWACSAHLVHARDRSDSESGAVKDQAKLRIGMLD